MAYPSDDSAFPFAPFSAYHLPLPAVLDAAAAGLVVVLAARGRPVVLDAAELREVRADALFVLEEFLLTRGAGPGPARISNLSPGLRARLHGSPVLDYAAAPWEGDDDERLFLCPDREGEMGFVPSGR